MALPEDVLAGEAGVADAPRVEPVETAPDGADMARLAGLLAAARRPLAIVGGSRWSAQAVAAFVRFAERFELPVAASFRRAGLFPADGDHFVGDLGLRRIRNWSRG